MTQNDIGNNRAAFSIEKFANVLQNFLSLVHDCCGTFANCFDTERSPGSILPDLCTASKHKSVPLYGQAFRVTGHFETSTLNDPK